MIFDLKGSLKGRITKFPISEYNWWLKEEKGHKKCLKDQNFLIINKDLNYKLLEMNESERLMYTQMIEKDSLFLARHNLMDYSLLLTIEQIKSKQHDHYNLSVISQDNA